MKKVYSLVGALVIAGMAFAQAPTGNLTGKKLDFTPRHTTGMKIDHRNAGYEKAATVFSDDFSTDATTTWTIVDRSAGGEPWTWNDGTGGWTSSATASTGYILFNSDAGGSGNAEDCDIISPSFDCSAMSTIALGFTHFFKDGWGGQGVVSVSADDGTTWVDVQTWSAASSADGANEIIDVTASLTGSSTCKIKFTWTGDWSWYWYIDDVTVFEMPTDEVAVNWAKSSAHPVVPIDQVVPVTFDAEVGNVGLNDATAVPIAVDVNAGTHQEAGVIASIPSGTNASHTFINSFTPAMSGLYEAAVAIAPAVDGDVTNNYDSLNFVVNDSIYASNYGPTAILGFGGGNSYSQQFEVTANDDLTSVTLYLYGPAGSTGSTVNAEIWTSDADTAAALIATTNDYVTTTEGATEVAVLMLPTPLAMTPGTYHIVYKEPAAFAGGSMTSTDMFFQMGKSWVQFGSAGAWVEMSNVALHSFAMDANFGVATPPPACDVQLSDSWSNPSGCSADGFIDATASNGVAPYTWAWSHDGANTTNMATGLAPGVYSYTATDANACAASWSITLTGGASLNVTTSSVDETCGQDNGEAAIDDIQGGDGNYNVMWDNGSGDWTNYNLSVGSYDVTVTDGSGCIITETVVVGGEDFGMSITTVETDQSACGAGDASVVATVTGGQTPYTYTWMNMADNGATVGTNSNTLSGLGLGYYVLEVSDGTCTIDNDDNGFLVSDPGAPNTTVTSNDVSCFGDSDGSVDVTVDGGQTPFTYAWSYSDGTTTQALASTASSLSGLTDGGVYIVTVLDANGCAALNGTGLDAPTEAFNITLSSSDVNMPGGSDGAAWLEDGSSNAWPYTYLWSNGGTDGSTMGLTAGTYTLTATDANGCTTSASVVISEPACSLTVNVTATDASTAGGNDGSITSSVSNQTGSLTYLWSNGATTGDITGLTSDVYTVTVNDGSCTATATTFVGEPGATPPCLLTVTASGTNVTTNGGSDGAITTSVQGALGNVTYLWSSTETTADLSGLVAGTYTVTATDDGATGCESVATVVITEPTGVSVAEVAQSTTFTIFPNPNAGQFTVKSVTGSNVVVRNVVGQVVYSNVLTSTATTVNLDVDKGIYFVTINNETKRVVIK